MPLPLEQALPILVAKVEEYRRHAEHWWRFHSLRKDVVFGLIVSSSAGAAIAGGFNIGWLAMIFGVVGGVATTVQRSYNFADKSWFYGRALFQINRMKERLELDPSETVYRDTLNALDNLRTSEGNLGAGGKLDPIDPKPAS
jgi:hypothetical protein